MTEPLYDEIGIGYSGRRVPDVRIAAAIDRALGDARTVVNVGAGAGSYEPASREVTAVELSRTMITQRDAAAPAVQASATALPFPDGAFDAALAILTVHHWPDRELGLREMARVASDRVVVLTWIPDVAAFWLVDDYFPEILEIDRRIMPPPEELRAALGSFEMHVVPIPADCTDGFLGAFWRRPEAYLDDGVRGAMSTFTKIAAVEEGVARLRRDLADGTWERRHGDLRRRVDVDLGYRLIVAGAG